MSHRPQHCLKTSTACLISRWVSYALWSTVAARAPSQEMYHVELTKGHAITCTWKTEQWQHLMREKIMECLADCLREGAAPVDGAFMAPQLKQRGNSQGSATTCICRLYRSAPDQNIQKYRPCGRADLHSVLRMLSDNVLHTSDHGSIYVIIWVCGRPGCADSSRLIISS